MMKNKIIYSCILLVLVAILVTSIFILYRNLKEEKMQQNEFEKLEEIIIEDEEKEEIKEDKKEQKEEKLFEIDNFLREKSIGGSEFEIKLKN